MALEAIAIFSDSITWLFQKEKCQRKLNRLFHQRDKNNFWLFETPWILLKININIKRKNKKLHCTFLAVFVKPGTHF